jgi:hypothetical protein
VEVGEAVTEEPVVALSPIAGLHVYDEAPVAVNVADWPTHIAGGAATKTGGLHGKGGNTTLSGQPPPLRIMSGPISSSAPWKFIKAG